MNYLPDCFLSYRLRVWIIIRKDFLQRKTKDESEIWSDTFGNMYYEAVHIQASECISLCHYLFNNIVPC